MNKLYVMRRIYKERFDKKISGVCGGLAQYFQFDASIIRVIWVLLSILSGGIFVMVYIILALLLPKGPKSYVIANYKKLYRSKKDKRIAGVCGGLGKYLKVDSNIIRLALVVITFCTAMIPLVLYCIASYVIPEEPL